MNRTYKKIDDLITEISMGPFGSDIKVEYFVDKGVPVLNGSNISGFKVTDDFHNYVTEERANGYRKAIAVRGDIVITHRGTLGQIAYVPDDSQYEKYVISQSQFKVRLDTDKVNPVYFTYYFHTNEGQQRLLSFKSHVGVPALAQATTNFRLLDFPLIPKSKQDAIASVLKILDQKIELNNQINAELEAMAKTLYDYWFVQFDFPDADGKPYKSSGGKMVYNEVLKREIPEGWEVKVLADIATTGSGGTPLSSKKEYYANGNIPWINSGELNTPFIVSTSNFITKLGLENSNAKLFKKNTILMAMYGATAGKVSFIDFPSATNQAICGINPIDQDMSVYLKFNLERLYQYLVNLSSGSARDNLSQDKIKNLDIVIPSDYILTRFDNMVNRKMQLIINNIKQNQELERLRDWLLPMLMNGQVTVK